MPPSVFADAEPSFPCDTLAASPAYAPARSAASPRIAVQAHSFWPNLTISLLPLLFSLLYFGITSANPYGPSHLLLTYHDGFLKRALMGTLFSPLGFLSTRTLFQIQLAAFATLAALTYWLFRRILFGSVQERCFGAFLLAGPALLPHFAYMSGELDTYLFIAAALALGSFLKSPGKSGLLMATAASIAGLLIHEAFALMFYPLVFAVAVELHRKRRITRTALVTHFATILCVFLAILHFGKLHAPMAGVMAAAQQRTNLQLKPTVFLVLGSTLGQQLAFVRQLYTPTLIAGALLALVLSIPYFAILVSLLRKALRHRGCSRLYTRLLLLALAGGPLLLCPLGHDTMRWVSASAINLSLYLLYLYSSEAQHAPARTALTTWTATPAFLAAFLYLAALGPYGIASNRLVANIGALLARLHS